MNPNLPSNYATLLAAGTPKEVRVLVYTSSSSFVAYGQDKIVAATINASLMERASTIGNCTAKRLTVTFRNPGEIPRMARLRVQFRLNGGTSATRTSWIEKGIFFVDTRSEGNGIIELTAYDAMLKADQPYVQSGEQDDWPQFDTDIVDAICARIGVELDPRTQAILTRNYQIQYPGFGDGAYTMRDILGFIGQAYAGNWYINDINKLMLVQFGDIPPETNYLVTENNDYITIGGYRILV